MPGGPYIYPQQIFDTSTLTFPTVPTLAQITAGVAAAVPTLAQIQAGVPTLVQMQAGLPSLAQIAALISKTSFTVSQSTVGFTGVQTTSTAGIYGAYSQLIASTGFLSYAMLITIGSLTGFSINARFAIATGAGGAEVDLIPDIGLICSSAAVPFMIYIPMGAPAGKRISARAVNDTSAVSVTFSVSLNLFG